MDWVLPTDELVALATTTSEDHNGASSKIADRDEEQGGLASRLRKFALHLKLAS